ncbi:Fungalysin/Thermolysin Extracellular metalloproteinase 5 [Ceratobasidium sp. 395]|nr:Fungalysin/Thermolysin Extracellular metalloproteinase 5 [Ceratobasidium sp. 395]
MEALRRTLVLSSLALAAFPIAQAHGGARKSLSFKQPLPHAEFTTTPPRLSVQIHFNAEPRDIARIFIIEHLLTPGTLFYIRHDSYTDQNTGISHFYARQLVNGLEVADGDVNLNIRDGQVISYGSSFARSIHSPTSVGWSQDTYCSELPKGSDTFACDTSLNRIRTAASMYPTKHHSAQESYDPLAAAYFFALAAYPDTLPSDLHMDAAIATSTPCVEEVHSNCWSVSGLPGILEPVQARLVYVQTHVHGEAQLNLAWRLEVTMHDNQYEAYVSALDSSKIIAVADWVKDAPAPRGEDGSLTALQEKVFGQSVLSPEESFSQVALSSGGKGSPGGTYRVWKWGINDPSLGDRTLEESPYDKVSSPLGWHSLPAGNDPVNSHPGMKADTIVNYTTTVGNNVIAQANWAGKEPWKLNHRPNGGPDLIFDFPYGANPGDDGWQTREPRSYVNASVTQLFYLANMYHDLLYLYGFDEASGNFQQFNFGKGGGEGDGVILDAQDSSGFNNANFMTPPDGTNGRCRMYIWNTAKPFRDGGLDAGILIHELSHGLSTRLTGGPSAPSCLEDGQSGGMGEGWGDWIATTVRSTSTYSDYPIAAWAANTKRGIRHFPYAVNSTVNPEMYDYLQRMDWREVHAIGEVWAEILWVVSNKLIEKHGFADSLFPSADPQFYRTVIHGNGVKQLVPNKGNTLALQLVVNGMKLQPCNPTFAQARDAIIQADGVLTGGENKCLLWSAFASRGLGTDAKKLTSARSPSINGFKVPAECQ